MSTTIPPNNNTGLYNTSASPATGVDGNVTANNITVSGNVNVGGYISAVGNIGTAGYVLGNGALLTGLPEIYGNANVAAFLPTYTGNLVSLQGPVTTTANITGNYILGNGALLTGLPETYANANVAAFLPVYNGNIGANVVTAQRFAGNGNTISNIAGANVTGTVPSATTAVTVTGNAQPNITSVGTLTSVTSTGNVQGGNILTGGAVSAAGTITGNILQTSGAQGNIIGANYVSANFYLGDGSLLTNLPSGNATLSGNLAGNLQGNGFGANAFAFVSATGNVSGNYILGNGSQLTGLPATYSNANVSTLLASFGSNTISTTGNITAGNFVGNGSLLTNITGANVTGTVANAAFATTAGTATTANSAQQANVANVANSVSGANVSGSVAQANFANTANSVSGSNVSGAVAQATFADTANAVAGGNVSGQVANALVAGTVYTNAQPNITSVGTLSSLSVAGNVAGGNLLINNNANITNDLTVGGTIFGTFAGNISGNLVVPGSNTQVIYNANGNAGASANFTFDYGNNIMSVTGNVICGNISTTGNITGNYILGNGSQLTGLPAGYSNADVNSHLAAFGSNTISTTGNITAGYFIGDGSALTNLPIQPGTYSNANVANYLPTYSGTITANVVSATGNITGSYIIGNGSQLTGLPAGYSNADVTTLLASFGSNTISTSGNITAGNLIGTVAQANVANLVNISNANSSSGTGYYVAFATGPGNNQVQIDDVGNGFTYTPADGKINLTAIDATGQILGNSIVSQTTVSATGNITGNYFIGNGSQLTGITTTANAGGSNTQIQFNNGNAFAGNAAMTFNTATGTVTLGNITTNNLALNTVLANVDLGNVTANANVTPWRITVGNLYNGSPSSIYAPTSPGLTTSAFNPRLLISDLVYIGNSTQRMQELTVNNWYVANANITNTVNRYSGLRTEVMFGGGPSGNTISSSPLFGGFGTTSQVYIGAGTNANLTAVGNITANSTAGFHSAFNGIQVNVGSTANLIAGQLNQVTVNNPNASSFGNAVNMVGYWSILAGTPANANITGTTTAISYYHPGQSSIVSIGGTGNIPRQATNYYAFRNDDDLAKSKLGMLDSFHELNANSATTTGNVTINKANGQVQTIYPTGNVAIAAFTNFVTGVPRPNGNIVNTADTVTLVIQQGATPYTVTMPTGNANIRYAGGVSTLAGTANTTTMISITGVYNYTTSNNQYLITISPEFA